MALRPIVLALALAAATAAPANADDAQALASALNDRITQCWSVTPDLPAHVDAVRVKFSLSETGELQGSPAIEGPVAGDPASKAFAASALRAVVRCAPYAGLAELAPYDAWKTVVVTFNRPDL